MIRIDEFPLVSTEFKEMSQELNNPSRNRKKGRGGRNSTLGYQMSGVGSQSSISSDGSNDAFDFKVKKGNYF